MYSITKCKKGGWADRSKRQAIPHVVVGLMRAKIMTMPCYLQKATPNDLFCKIKTDGSLLATSHPKFRLPLEGPRKYWDKLFSMDKLPWFP